MQLKTGVEWCRCVWSNVTLMQWHNYCPINPQCGGGLEQSREPFAIGEKCYQGRVLILVGKSEVTHSGLRKLAGISRRQRKKNDNIRLELNQIRPCSHIVGNLRVKTDGSEEIRRKTV